MAVPADSSSSRPVRVEHVRGLDALPLVTSALAKFAPAVLLTSEGLGAIHASLADPPEERQLFFLADARTLLDWEAHRRHIVTLTFQSPDERVFLTVSGKAEVITDHEVTARMWRPSFKRWFPGGADDPRLLLVQFSLLDAEFYEAADGRVTAYLTH
ncbi:MAG TPA: pyridoxamine 5'-phosphate oxidase family protein [Vicinamibacterales bacterium]|nr:pyridoxamine 5'-phosphate oxidase family protein [Vicinamibacterales bacterium]